MTANNKATNEFKAVAREAAQLGARFVGATRDWFDSRRQEAGRASTARHTTHGGPSDDEDRIYGRDEHASHASTGAAARRGGFRGVGPRGYTRTDERIREDVCEGLCDSNDIDASDIHVDVGSGTVRLSGTVPSRAMKHYAEDIAESCSGVRDIENSIRVAGVDQAGGANAYRSSGSHGGNAHQGATSAGYGSATGAPASPAGTPGSTASTTAAGNTSGYGQGGTPSGTTTGPRSDPPR
jgi:hypothetical protein